MLRILSAVVVVAALQVGTNALSCNDANELKTCSSGNGACRTLIKDVGGNVLAVLCKQPSPGCDVADGYVDYNACTSSLKPEIRVVNGNLRVTGNSVTLAANGQVTLESGDPSCAEGAVVAIDGLACTVQEHKAGLVDLSDKIAKQAETMQTEFGIKLPALKDELTEIVRKSEVATSSKIDSSLKLQAASVEKDIAQMKVDLEKVVENDITALKLEVEEMGKKLDELPDLTDTEYTSEQALFVLDYEALGKGSSGFRHLVGGVSTHEKNLRLRVADGALNIRTEGPETPVYYTTNPFPGGRASQNDHFQMIVHPKIVDSKIMVDDSKSGQITVGFASKQADKKIGELIVPQRKILFSATFWSSKDGKDISICIEGADNKCIGDSATVKVKNSDSVKSVVLRYLPKSDTNPNSLVEVEAYLGLNGKGKSLGKGKSELMKGVSFTADDMFIRQGLSPSEAASHGIKVSEPKQLMLKARRGAYTIKAHPRRCGIGGNEKNLLDENPRSSTGGWPNYGFQQCCSQGTCTMDIKLDKEYEVTKQAVCGYPGGSHRPSGSWVFEGKTSKGWQVLDTLDYSEWTVGNCYASKKFKKELTIPSRNVITAREFRVRSTSGWTNNHMLMFNWGIWGCDGSCSGGGLATMNIAKVAISVVEQHVGLTEIINLLLAQQIATAQTAVQAGYLATAQGSREELEVGSCEGNPENMVTKAKQSEWMWKASQTCGGIGGTPRNIADQVNRKTTGGWPTYGFQQRCCGLCYIEIDFRSDNYHFCSFGIFGYPGGSHKPNNKWFIQGFSQGSWKMLSQQSDNSKWVADKSGSYPIKSDKYMMVEKGMETVPVTKLRIGGNGFTNNHMLVFNFEAHGYKRK